MEKSLSACMVWMGPVAPQKASKSCTWERLQRVCIASLEMSSMGPCRKFPQWTVVKVVKIGGREIQRTYQIEVELEYSFIQLDPKSLRSFKARKNQGLVQAKPALSPEYYRVTVTSNMRLYIYRLVVLTILKNMKVSWAYDSQSMEIIQMFQATNQL